MVRWYAEKGVDLRSPFSSVGLSSPKKHWDHKKEDHVNVTISRYDLRILRKNGWNGYLSPTQKFG